MIESGNHVLYHNVSEQKHLDITFVENSKGSMVLIVSGDGALDFQMTLQAGSDWSVLWLNQSHHALTIKETVTLCENVKLKMNYGELSDGNHTKTTCFHMIGEHASVFVKGASLVSNGLFWDIKALHHAKHTYAQLDNHVIVMKDTKLKMEVIGQIDKSYSKSETHQMTRIMNLGDEANVIVFPKLLIDENDVAASHAASVGRPNPEHVYYLQSRGITKNAAYRMLIRGYLLPITNDIHDASIKTMLIEEIEKKVDDLWIK